MPYSEIDWKCINTVRVLAVDATFNANSGHPGAPMGMAPVAHVLFNKFMKFNPKNPGWLNRDRFILSNGHGCMLQYALLHLYGYKVTMEDLKQFRSVGSKTPGHPESCDTEGIEVTTGPLGQGFANSVGLAIAQAHTAAQFNKPGFDIVDNYTYTFFGDGCAMEGISSEAASLAGHLKLGNLIMVYDDNKISIDGTIECAFTEDVTKRFEAYGWHTQWLKDGDNDLEGMEAAIRKAREVKDKPSMIRLSTTIGFGSLHQGTGAVHGSALKEDDCKQVRKRFGFDPEKLFVVEQDVYDFFHKKGAEGAALEQEWNKMLEKYGSQHKEEHADLMRRLSGKLPDGWQKALPTYKASDKAIATRKTSEAVLEAIQSVVPELVSGSADLTPSNNTLWKGAVEFQPPGEKFKGDWSGRYIRYGVREHAMAGAMNGLACYGTVIPAGGTFLNFVSYASGSVRLSAISRQRVIYIATHDSIGLGEDGPTHQPIETLAHFRAMPNMMVWRPADGNETSAAYYVAMTTKTTPSIFALSRQNLPQLESSTLEKASKGGYVALDEPSAAITLVSTGSEVSICLEAAKQLKEKGKPARVVSLPCVEVFDSQPKDYRLSVIPDGIPAMSVEALSTLGWEKYSHEQFGLNRFGASGAGNDVYKKFEFTPEGVTKRAVATVDYYKDVKPLRSPINRAFTQLI